MNPSSGQMKKLMKFQNYMKHMGPAGSILAQNFKTSITNCI